MYQIWKKNCFITVKIPEKVPVASLTPEKLDAAFADLGNMRVEAVSISEGSRGQLFGNKDNSADNFTFTSLAKSGGRSHSISITLGARVDQQVHYIIDSRVRASGSASMEQANFLSRFVKIQFFAVKFFRFSFVTHSAVYVSFEPPSANCKRVKVFGTNL